MRHLVFLLLLFILSCAYNPKACINSHCFSIEIADSPEERTRGLMYRQWLDPDSGMLFIFEEAGRHGFWMKNTYIPLDILWINETKHIIFISKNVSPCTNVTCPVISPPEDAKYVLEINAGRAQFEIGDKVII